MIIKNKRVLVLGMGRVGRSIVDYLLKSQALVYAYDEKVRKGKIKIFHSPEEIKGDIDLVITSPGFDEDSEIIKMLRRKKIKIVDEIEFTSWFIKSPIIAITGTNGKSTTTALLGEILKRNGDKVFVGGNIAPGVPFSSSLLLESQDIYVIEVSTFQLERCETLRPKIGILLNISLDHLNRHKDFSHYIALKFSLFSNQRREDYAVLNIDDKIIGERLFSIKSQVVPFSLRKKVDGVYISNNYIYFKDEKVCGVDRVKLPGEHNLTNVLACVGASKLLKIDSQIIEGALGEFKGLPHRLERIRIEKGVEYINNSMCTNPTSAIASLRTFKKPVILIAGGKEKGLPLNEFIKEIKRRARRTILIGSNRESLKQKLIKEGYKEVEAAQSLQDAVIKAKGYARKGDVVLFSPGFASFDEFKDFQDRGEAFRNAVRDL